MKTVYVGLSGGVDSSVSAALLKQQGYSVVGVYMKNWTADVAGVACPWKQDLADARAVAAKLDIAFKVFDFQEAYRQQVVDVMVAEYAAGRTPNPDVLCNQEIKFKLFLDAALADGADMIATGHYARVQGGKLLTALDASKDQTYFLCRVSGVALKKALFPLGELKKTEVRQLAIEFGLPTAKKPDSQGICFVGEVGIRAFLGQYMQVEAGPIVDRATKAVVGSHAGAVYYTAGQRHGLGVGGGTPYYVTGKDMASNTVFVTDNPDVLSLDSLVITLTDPHWVNTEPESGSLVHIRLRHRGELVPGRIVRTDAGWTLELDKPPRGVAAGQSAVVYQDGVVLGGGFISA